MYIQNIPTTLGFRSFSFLSEFQGLTLNDFFSQQFIGLQYFKLFWAMILMSHQKIIIIMGFPLGLFPCLKVRILPFFNLPNSLQLTSFIIFHFYQHNKRKVDAIQKKEKNVKFSRKIIHTFSLPSNGFNLEYIIFFIFLYFPWLV